MFKNISSKQGAASVLVVVMMLVLMVFGLAMVTTTLAQLRLSNNHEAWVVKYYELEIAAQKRIADIDSILYQTETEVVAYMKSGDILNPNYNGPIANHRDYSDGFIIQDSVVNQSQYLTDIFPMIYMEQLAINLDGIETLMPGTVVSIDENITGMSDITIKSSVTNKEEDYKKYIAFELKARIPEYSISYNGQIIDGIKAVAVADRYSITNYFELQEPVQYEEDIKFGNPFEKPADTPADTPADN
jgi:hypothetical protein